MRGIIVHDGIVAHYDNQLRDWLHDRVPLMQQQLNAVPADQHDKYEQEMVDSIDMLTRYAEWAPENDDFVVVNSHVKAVIQLGGYPFQFELDAVVRRPDGKLWVQEYKTAKRPLNEDIVEMDAQLTTYCHCAEQHIGQPITGLIYTQVPVSVAKSGIYAGKPVIRYYLHRTPDQIARFLDETIDQIGVMVDSPKIYRTPDRSCSWDCHYEQLCRIEAQGGDAQALRESKFIMEAPHA